MRQNDVERTAFWLLSHPFTVPTANIYTLTTESRSSLMKSSPPVRIFRRALIFKINN